MKKLTVLFCLFSTVLLLLSSCRDVSHTENETSQSPDTVITESETHKVTVSDTTEAAETANKALPLPEQTMEFSFLSGAGAWRTTLILNADGIFTGTYWDSEMGEFGNGYPDGSVYVSVFSGKFENIEKINEYSYKMTLTEINTETPVGEEWIENGIRYVASHPNGLYGGTEFIFYLPETPVDSVPEDFLFWWPYGGYYQSEDPRDTLDCYGILNVATSDGFFNT